MNNIEIDQQSHRPPAQSHVRKQLGFVDRIDGIDTFNFDNNGITDDQVDTIAEIDLFASVDNRQSHLTISSESAFSNLMQEAGVICAFEQAGAKRSMNFHC